MLNGLAGHAAISDLWGRVLLRTLLPAGALAAVLLLNPAPAHADTYIVDTTIDVLSSACTATANDCSLRGAIDKANANPGPDTIILPAGIYRLTLAGTNENANQTGDLDILDDIEIIGAGGNPDGDASQTIIQSGSSDMAPGTGVDKIMSINPNWDKVVNASLKAVTLRYGKNTSPFSGDGYGGALDMEATPYNNSGIPGVGSLTIYNCIITYNSTADGDGGGIAVVNGLNRAGGMLTITNTEITNNTATNGSGGGISTSLAYTVTGTTLNNNSSVYGGSRGGYGGAIEARGGGTISNTTISGNTVAPAPTGRGAGMVVTGGLTMTNVTISGNTGASQGGGLWVNGDTNPLTNLTVTGNSATTGSGIYWGDSGTITLKNSIVWNNNIAGTVPGSADNLIGVDPGIGPLANNGGRVMTHALLAGSAAIDAGDNGAISLTTDARGTGYARKVDGDGNGTITVDIGAYEADNPADLAIAFPGGTFAQGQTDASYTISVTNVGSAPTSGTVTVTATLGSGLSNPRLSGPGWTCNNGTLTCTRGDALLNGSTYPITLLVDVNANAPVSVTNSASVSGTGDADLTNNTASSTTTIRQNTTVNVSAVTATYGSTTTLSASVTPGVAGTVQFSAGGPGVIGTATVNTGTGAASTGVQMAFTPNTYTLTATFVPTDPTYLQSTGSDTLTVSKAPLTITADDTNKTYGSANPALTATYTGFVLGEDQSALTGSLSLTTTATAGSTVGTYPITVGGYTSANYAITYANGLLTVDPAPLTITASNAGRTYGGANPAFSVAFAGFVLGEDETDLTGSLTISTTAVAASAPGKYPITPSGYSAANYAITYQSGQLAIDPAPLTVTAGNADRLYGAANPAFSATYAGFVLGENESVLTGTLSLSTTATATSPAGSYPITASGLSSSNYTILFVPGALTVNPAPLTITADDQTRVYGAADPAFTSTPTGLVNGETAAVITGTPLYTTTATATSSPGGYPISVSGLSAANYTITYQTGTLTVTQRPLTIAADNQSRPYGSANPTLTASYSGFATGEDETDLTGTLSISTAADAASGAGTYPITASGYSSVSYAISYAPGTLTVTPAALTITADSASRTYGAANPAFSATYTGFVEGEDETVLTGSLSLTTTATATSPAGTYPITAGDLTSSNYTITFVDGTLTVNKAPLTVTAQNASRTYGAANPAFAVAYSGFVLSEDETALGGALTYTAPGPTAGVGLHPIQPAGLTSANYAITFVDGVLTVTPAPVTVTANDASKVYGSANPGFSVSYSGFVLGETEAALGGTLGFATAATGSSPAGTYAVTPSGLTAANYDLTFAPGILTVTPAPLTVTADAASKVYGSANPAFTVSYSGFVLGETQAVLTGALTFSTTATEASPAGTYAVTPGGLTSPTYTITFQDGSLTVDKAPLTVRADDKIRVFGAPNPTLTASYTGLVLNETEAVLGGTLTLATTATPASATGTYPITVNGLTAANYTITFVPGTLTVTNATLTIRAVDQSRRYGDPNPAFTATYTGFVGGDTEAVLTGTLTLSTTAAVTSPVGAYPITPAGVTASNYLLVFEPGTLTVTPRPLYVSAGNDSRAYGDPNPSLSGSVSGAVNGDVIHGHFGTSATLTSPVGTYPIGASASAAPGVLSNYTVQESDGVLTVTPALLTVQPNDASRTYGKANPTFQGTVTGLKNGEQVTVTFATTATDTSTVGIYPIAAQVAGVTSNYTVTLVEGKLTVLPAPLTVTVYDAAKVAGEPNPPLKGEVSGALPADALHAEFSTTAARSSEPGTYPIKAQLRDPRGKLSNYTVTVHEGTLTVTTCDATHGFNGDRAVSSTGCRSGRNVEEAVREAMGPGDSAPPFLVVVTTSMVEQTIDHAREGEAPPILIMQALEQKLSGGMIDLAALGLLAEAGGDLHLQTSHGSLRIPARTLQEFAGGPADSRLVILFEETGAVLPQGNQHKPASPVIEITIATLAEDGTASVHKQFPGGLIIALPVAAGPDGVPPDLELAGIYHVSEDADGNLTRWTYIGGEVDTAGTIAGRTDHLSKYAVLLLDREYADVGPDHWAHRPVKVMSARHVVNGVGGSLFAPDRPVTRAEFATMTARAFGIQPLPVLVRPFADVAPNAWHAGIMLAVVEAGLFTPEAGNTLRPDVPISREEMAVVIARAMARFSPQPTLDEATVDRILAPFQDQGLIAPENRDELASLVAAGLLRGRAVDALAPQGTTTRAEAVTLIKRLQDWEKANR